MSCTGLRRQFPSGMFYVLTNLYPNITCLSFSCSNTGELPRGAGQERNND